MFSFGGIRVCGSAGAGRGAPPSYDCHLQVSEREGRRPKRAISSIYWVPSFGQNPKSNTMSKRK